MTLVQRTFRYDPQQLARLEKLATEQKRSLPEILRLAIDHFLKDHKLLVASERRHVRMTEYAQAALDTIILEQHPEYRERIIAETERRMERYHGGL